MSSLYYTIMDFKDRQGRNGLAANPLLIGLMTHDAKKKSLSHTLFKERMSYVQNDANNYFYKNTLTRMNPVALDNGGESLVVDCQNAHVLKLRRGRPYSRFKTSLVLQPCHEEYNQELDINYSIFTMAEDTRIGLWDTVKASLKAASQGFIIHDPQKMNFGYTEDGVVLIDYGAIHQGKGIAYNFAYTAFSLTKKTLSPLLSKYADFAPLLARVPR